MSESLFSAATRTATNVFALGIICAASIFTASLLSATGQKFVETFAEDFSSLRKESLPFPTIKRAA